MNKEKVIFLCLMVGALGVFTPFAAMYTHRAVSNWWYILTHPPATNITVSIDYNSTKPGTNLTYTDISAHTAMEALEKVATVVVSALGWIDAINGVYQVGSWYWIFYHNDAFASATPGDTLLSTNDVILMNLTKY